MGSCLAFCHILLYLHCFSYEDNYAVAYELTLGRLSVNLYWFGSKFVNGLSKFSAVCLKHRQKRKLFIQVVYEDAFLPLLVIWGHEGLVLARG